MSYSNPQTSYIHTTFPTNSFWGRRRHVVQSRTLLVQLDMLKKTGRYDAFKLKWHPIYNDPPSIWPVPKHLFWDSDVAKWIEGACYFVAKDMAPGATNPGDKEIRAAVDELVEMIRGAQQEDGYLNIHFTVVDPDGRWKDLRDLHELYNAGHLIEAALAHHCCFQNTQLLEPVLKYVDLLCKTFGPQKSQILGYPGHPEIELALLRLWRLTNDPKHLRLAQFFIDERGNPDSGGTRQHYYDIEKAARGEREHEWPQYMPVQTPYRYMQAHLPITQQPTIEGHSVRAMYLLTGVADLSILQQSSRAKYAEALHRLWNNMVRQKMYLTGGIGAIPAWEGFGQDYFLPQGDDEGADGGGAYLETCAAIGVVMLAERLLQLELKSEYSDIMELCLYNAVLTGMSHDGAAFTYVNQLASSEGSLSKRSEWFEVSCCPPNVSRLFGSVGGYVWTVEKKDKAVAVNIHLYTAAALKVPVDHGEVEIEQKTDLPYGDGRVSFSIRAPVQTEVVLRLRIPGWARSWEVSLLSSRRFCVILTQYEDQPRYRSVGRRWVSKAVFRIREKASRLRVEALPASATYFSPSIHTPARRSRGTRPTGLLC